MRHAHRFLHGHYARLEPFAQTDDEVQQRYLKILRNQDRFWVDADGQPVREAYKWVKRMARNPPEWGKNSVIGAVASWLRRTQWQRPERLAR
jgi:hypothetical protein